MELESFTRAAGRLRVAQPALGVQIQKLEAELGHQLLLRHSRGVQPTEAGRLFLAHARKILEDVQEAELSLANFAGPPTGAVLLGMPPNFSGTLSVKLVRRAMETYPRIFLSITEGLSQAIIDRVDEGKLDIGCVFEVQERSNLSVTPLLSDQLVLASPPCFRLPEGRRSISFADVANLPLILPGSVQRLRVIVEDAAAQQGLHLNVIVEAESEPLMRNLVSQGLGHTLLPYSSVRDDVLRNKLAAHSLEAPNFVSMLYLIYREDRPLSRAASAVIGCVRDIAAEEGTRFAG